MKNPHTLPRLRSLYRRSEMTLARERVTTKTVDKFYNELASIPAVTVTAQMPSVELPAAERARRVRRLIRDTFQRIEIDAAGEWGPRVRREHDEAKAPPERVQQEEIPL